MSREAVQAAQYELPYHFIPTRARRGWHWPYSVEYVLYMEAVLERLHGRVLDVGCGDGRLVAEGLARGLDIIGVDLEPRAIRWAKALGLPCERMDARDVTGTFDVVTAVDVLEHVPDIEVPEFLWTLACKGNTVIITVPTWEHDVPTKHYRHYSAEELEATLRTVFDEVEVVGLLGASWTWDLVNRLPFEALTPWLFAHAPAGDKRPRHLLGVAR